REALLVLVHYVGDIHQPLHVGAVYLDAAGMRVNPDTGTFDPQSETRGGNEIAVGSGKNLHATWDAVLSSVKPSGVNAQWLSQAKAVPPSTGAIYTWPVAWAGDTQKEAIKAFQALTFG